MLDKIKQHINSIAELKDQIAEHKDSLHNTLYPICKEMGKDFLNWRIDDITIYPTAIKIDWYEYFRGERHDESFRIPNEILNASDPITAAKEYAVKLEAAINFHMLCLSEKRKQEKEKKEKKKLQS